MPKLLISKRGRRIDVSAVERWVGGRPDGDYFCEVAPVRCRRSGRQNRWLWGCVYPLLLGGLTELGWEYTNVDQVHAYCMGRFAGTDILNRETGETMRLPMQSHRMTTTEFAAYCERLRDFGRDELGVDVPEPNALGHVQ